MRFLIKNNYYYNIRFLTYSEKYQKTHFWELAISGGPRILGFWEMPKMAVLETGIFGPPKNGLFSGPPKKAVFFWAAKKRPKKQAEKRPIFRTWEIGRFLATGTLSNPIFLSIYTDIIYFFHSTFPHKLTIFWCLLSTHN